MTHRAPRFEHLGRRFGTTYEERVYGSPLEPWVDCRIDAPAHRAWFVGGKGGEVGALFYADELYLAVGRGGLGWRFDNGALESLCFDQKAPEVLRNEPSDLQSNKHTVLFARRRPLADMRFCRVTPKVGQRYFLSSGLSVQATDLQSDLANAELMERVAASQPEPKRGILARLLGSAPVGPTGAALILGCHDDESPPVGFLPWLEYHQRRGISFGWMGNEGGGELVTHSEPAPEVNVDRALLEILEKSETVREGLFEEAWEEWREFGDAQPGFEQLIEDAPQRGFWRRSDLVELEQDLSGRASEYLNSGTSDARLLYERHIPGRLLVEHLQKALIEPVALALHQVPSDESVVVWFAIGGISKSSGQLEVMVVQRVWS